MRQLGFVLAAAITLLCLPAGLRAAPLPPADSKEAAARDSGAASSATGAAADATSASANAPASAPVVSPPASASSVADTSADKATKGEPKVAKSTQTGRDSETVLTPRMAYRHAKLACHPRPALRLVKRILPPPRVAVPRTPVWPAASFRPECAFNGCWRFVLLGVGY